VLEPGDESKKLIIQQMKEKKIGPNTYLLEERIALIVMIPRMVSEKWA